MKVPKEFQKHIKLHNDELTVVENNKRLFKFKLPEKYQDKLKVDEEGSMTVKLPENK